MADVREDVPAVLFVSPKMAMALDSDFLGMPMVCPGY